MEGLRVATLREEEEEEEEVAIAVAAAEETLMVAAGAADILMNETHTIKLAVALEIELGESENAITVMTVQCKETLSASLIGTATSVIVETCRL